MGHAPGGTWGPGGVKIFSVGVCIGATSTAHSSLNSFLMLWKMINLFENTEALRLLASKCFGRPEVKRRLLSFCKIGENQSIIAQNSLNKSFLTN